MRHRRSVSQIRRACRVTNALTSPTSLSSTLGSNLSAVQMRQDFTACEIVPARRD